uniref:Guanylate cyclase n=1 Tax=Saccoglossus kowalevskii TaxID=10224 RepID=A0ABM0GMA9_SACKO|nr:PREDICTED: atrial natriuretic peptide receptor 1-like [Saccoglossus kowalevskii]
MALLKLKLGFLAPWTNTEIVNDFSGATSAGAINIAIDRIKEMDLVEDLEFEIVTRDSSCDSKQAAGYTVDMHLKEHVDVIIGPPCSSACMISGQLAAFWNIPIISWVATSPDFDDKNIYSTLGRSLGPFTKLGMFLMEIMASYNWNRAVIVYSTFLLYGDAGKAIEKTFNDNNVTLSYVAIYNSNPTRKKIQSILRKIKREGRIIVVCVPQEDRRMLLLEAYDMGMTKGDYVFYTVEMLPGDDVITAQETYLGIDRNEEAREAFEAVFHMSLAALTGADVDMFTKEVARRAQDPPWGLTLPAGIQGDKYSAFLYDAIILYALALNDSLSKGKDHTNGVDLLQSMSNMFFKGMTGMVMTDAYGDREPDYWITDLQPNGVFEKISEVVNLEDGTREFRQLGEPRWPGGKVGHQYAPPDVPVCGFNGEFCKEDDNAYIYIVGFSAGVIIIVMATLLFVWLYRRSNYEADLLNMRWKIHLEDLHFTGGGSQKMKSGSMGGGSAGSHPSLNSGGDILSKHSSNLSHSLDGKSSAPSNRTLQYFAKTATYRGVVVALKKINKEHLQINRNVLMEFNDVRQLSHENLNQFIGACVESNTIFLGWQYCDRGSIVDVLQNDEIRLDDAFKLSFITDIVKGMEYLHKSQHGGGSHGNLKSSNCLVDNRWVVKITDYGLQTFFSGQTENENTDDNDKFLRKLWTAPEILRMNFPPACGTQKGDVYSFAVIIFEILERTGPYCFDHITPRDVVNRIRNGESSPYRPVIMLHNPDSCEYGRELINLMVKCWSENVDNRPLFPRIRLEIRALCKGKEISIMDNILNMMEKYANNLEEIVEQRTGQVLEEKQKTDQLLYRMLPVTVAEALKLGQNVPPEDYESCTIYFSDIDGFAELSAESSPIQIVDFLNDLYSCFDEIIGNHDVYKVETIGDAYMIVSGLPHRNGNRHLTEIANCSLDLLSSATSFQIRHRPSQKLQLRIGLHTGPVVAGVVGLVMPRYCLFGDTVNITSRMESTGKPLHIHVSKQLYTSLRDINEEYHLARRGDINVKGKGVVPTYYLYGKDGYKKPLPNLSNASKLSGKPNGERMHAAEAGGDYEKS